MWTKHEISRRGRGMFDKFWPRDMDGYGDIDFATTRGNSSIYDGVLWLETGAHQGTRAVVREGARGG